MKSIPLRAATAASHVVGASLPIGVTAPSPVTATRFTQGSLRRALGVPVRTTRPAGRTPLQRAENPPPDGTREVIDESSRRAVRRARGEAAARVLLLAPVGPLPPRRRIPRAGASAAAQPRDVLALPARCGRETRARHTIPRPQPAA